MTIRLLRLLLQPPPLLIVAGAVLTAAAITGAASGLLALEKRCQPARRLLRSSAVPLLCFACFALSDWAMLTSLPVLRLSFAPSIHLPLMASLFVRLALLGALLGLMTWAARQPASATKPASPHSVLAFLLGINLAFSGVQVYAYAVEPLWLETTHLTLAFDDLDPAAPPLRILQIADPHIERSSYREAAVIAAVNELSPDLIVLTGDYLNLSYLNDPTSAEDFRRFASQLHAPYGVYAVRGTVDAGGAAMRRLLGGTEVIWLEQEAVTINVRGQRVTLVGVACSHHQETDTRRLEEAMAGIGADAFVLLLYHSPDLIYEAAALPVDLYLAGHTHGGQIRLPLVGPPVTLSRYGQRYAAGLFVVDGTTMYVSRGLGFEGGAMPRARFLCRPEIVLIELQGR